MERGIIQAGSFNMNFISGALVLGLLLSAANSAPVPGTSPKEDSISFLSEAFHISLPRGSPDVVFQPTVGSARGELVLMKAGEVQSPRAKLNQLQNFLVLDNIGETDEGLYIVTSQDPDNNSTITRTINLIVRDCTMEQKVKYGDSFSIRLNDVSSPISLEFRPISVEANETSRPALSLMGTNDYQPGYENRLLVTDSQVTLQSVTGADEGSYTIVDSNGKAREKVCLNVKEYQNFHEVPYGGTLKFTLLQNSSLVRLIYIPDSDSKPWVIMDKGNLTIPENTGLQDRLTVDGSMCILEGVKSSDAGVFELRDLDGFLIAKNHLKVEPFKLPPLYVTLIALVALVVLMLLICLLACIVKIRKRAEKSRAIEKIAKNAGQEEGDAFRQVVKDACKQAEDANVQSVKEDITEKSQSTEVSIKGLEVSSKEVTAFDKNLETSDSGVGFNTTALPLDSDTEAPSAPIQDSDLLSSSVATESKAAPTSTPEPKPAPPPTPEPKSSPPPEPKTSPPPVPKTAPPESPEPKASPPSVPKPAASPTPDPKPALTPTPEPKSPAPKSPAPKSPVPEAKAATPEAKLTSTPPPEPKAVVTPPPEIKPAVSPMPKSPALEKPAAADPPADLKPPASPDQKPKTPEPKPTPSPEPKATLSPAPESKPAVTPPAEPKALTPDPKPASSPKPAVSPAADSIPTTNGAPELKPDGESTAPGLDILGSESPKIAPPKSPDVGKGVVKAAPAEASSKGDAEPVINDSAPAAPEEAATT